MHMFLQGSVMSTIDADSVARRLMRLKFGEMTSLLIHHGLSDEQSQSLWADMPGEDGTVDLLQSNGWTLIEYINYCKNNARNDEYYDYRWLMIIFLRHNGNRSK